MRPTGRSRRFSRTLRQIRSAGKIFPRAKDRARLASHALTPIASRDLHAQAGPPPEKTITLASLIAPRMVRRHDASRRDRASRQIRVTSAAPRLPILPRGKNVSFSFSCPAFSFASDETLFRARRGRLTGAHARLPHDPRTRHAPNRVAATVPRATSPSRTRRAKRCACV